MHLRIDIRIDADEDIGGFIPLRGGLLNMRQIELAVNVNQHPMFNGETEFVKRFPVAVEDSLPRIEPCGEGDLQFVPAYQHRAAPHLP